MEMGGGGDKKRVRVWKAKENVLAIELCQLQEILIMQLRTIKQINNIIP